MRETAPDLPRLQRAAAERFWSKVETHFAYLVAEFGFAVDYRSEDPKVLRFARGGRQIVLGRSRDGLEYLFRGGDAGFAKDAESVLHSRWAGHVGGFGTELDIEEEEEPLMAKWSDAFYPILARFMEVRTVRHASDCGEPSESTAVGGPTWISLSELGKVESPPYPPAPSAEEVGFAEDARACFGFLESEYGLSHSTEHVHCEHFPDGSCQVDFVREIPPAGTAVLGVRVEHCCRTESMTCGVHVGILLRYERYGQTVYRMAPLRGSIDWTCTQFKYKHPSRSIRTKEDVHDLLLERAQLLREHGVSVLRGDLERFRENNRQRNRAMHSAAVAWARKEVERAWGLNDWYEVVRLYRWMGTDRTPEETARLEEAKRLLGPNPVNPWLREIPAVSPVDQTPLAHPRG
jgi:hypothetical protein